MYTSLMKFEGNELIELHAELPGFCGGCRFLLHGKCHRADSGNGVLSGWVYQSRGLEGNLCWSTVFILLSSLVSMKLPVIKQ